MSGLKKGKSSGGGEGEAQGSGGAAVVHDEGHGEHGGDGDGGRMSLRATEQDDRAEVGGAHAGEERRRVSTANMQEVPEAESQLKLKMAAYLAGAGTTGGMRRIWLCRPGQGKAMEALLRMATKGWISPGEDEDNEQGVGHPGEPDLAAE